MSYIEDFVNREKQLNLLRKVIRQEMDIRVLLLESPEGSGKSYLLDECRSECTANNLLHAYVDFTESTNRDYLSVVHTVRRQLGGLHFSHLDQTISETRTLGHWQSMPTPPMGPMMNPYHSMNGSTPKEGGDLHFHDGTVIEGDVVGRDINYITQIIHNDDPVVQREIQHRITEAFQSCLLELASTHTIIFFIDAWEKSTTETGQWINTCLFQWILEKKMPKIVAVVAGSHTPQLKRFPTRIGKFTLDGLPENALRTYWVERRGLPLSELKHIMRLTRGNPAAVAMLADMQAQPMELLI